MKVSDKRSSIPVVIIVIAVLCSVSLLAIAVHTPKIPAGIHAVLSEQYPNNTLLGLKPKVDKYQLYGVELMGKDGHMIELLMDQDGVVISEETKAKSDSLPFDAQTVLPGDAKLEGIEKVVKYATVKPITRDEPETEYKFIVKVNGKEQEIKTTVDGTLITK